MLSIPPAPLSQDTALALADLQRGVDAVATYAERVAAAKRAFSSSNKKGDATFDKVRETLTSMCGGRRRCMYCEDSVADEVEHFWPKDLYPEHVFAWMNYLYACGPCNGPKNNKFQVLSHATQTIVDVTRPRGAPVTEPERGAPMLIDPRREDPLSLLRLDIRETFLFGAIHARGTREFERAQYTITVLHLNDRAHLADARRDAYEAYCAMLHRYALQVKAQAAPEQRARTVNALRRTHHPTVWAEMKRQHPAIADLRALFGAAPEALGW